MSKKTDYADLRGVAEEIKHRMETGIARLSERADGWINTVTGLGGMRDKTRAVRMCGRPLLSPEVLHNIYMEDDLAEAICTKLPEAALSRGFSFSSDEGGALSDLVTRWGVIPTVIDAAVWARAYGGGGIIIEPMGGDTSQPLEMGEKISDLVAFDRRSLARVLNTDHYRLSSSGRVVHESRLIIFPGERTPASTRTDNQGWDVSSLQRPYQILQDTATNWASMCYLLSDASQSVMKIKGLIDMMRESQPELFSNRLELINIGRSIAKAIVLDADSESFEQVGAANLAGVSPLIGRTWERLAAAAGMPVSVLMGISPAGLQSTGNVEMALWHNRIQAYRERGISPGIQKLLELLAASEGLDRPITIVWPSLVEIAPQDESTRRKTVAETDQIYVNMGAIRPDQVAISRWGQGKYSSEMLSLDDGDGPEVGDLANALIAALGPNDEPEA